MDGIARRAASRRAAFSLWDRARQALGIARSLRVYYGNRERRRAMQRLYGLFLAPGQLAFDIGAHVGDRTQCFRRLGCRVVAVEPQRVFARLIWALHLADRDVAVVEAAVGRRAGMLSLSLNVDNPTVATASHRFIHAARRAPGWAHERWTRDVSVPLVTLDGLIARYGRPAFVKIDVEGFEAEVLAGLRSPVAALSFEFTTLQRDVALRALARCEELGPYRYSACLGESQRFLWSTWRAAGDVERWLQALPADANSGDIYAALDPPPARSMLDASALS